MSCVYAKVDDLDGTAKVGSHQCLALLQHDAKLPVTAQWEAGKSVFGRPDHRQGHRDRHARGWQVPESHDRQ